MFELFRFPGGVKPASNKQESAGAVIAAAPLPERLVVPFRQSATGSATIQVRAGEKVLKGQMIGSAEGAFGTTVHAPTSGTVLAVESRMLPHPSGLAAPCAVIEPDGAETWIERVPLDPFKVDPQIVRARIRDAGIVGLGGAVFPSHVKANVAIDTLIINGAECEPWITCDDRLMRERTEDVVCGAALLGRLMGAKRILIGIEDNKPEAVQALRAAISGEGYCETGDMQVVSVPTLYPAGGEKQLIRVLTGMEVPYGKLSPEFGIQCFNVGTAYAVARAVLHGEPLIARIVTLAGNYARPGNFEVLIGTPMNALLPLGTPQADTDRIVMGGPMMGFALADTSVPVVKATNCLLAMSQKLFPPPLPEMPCIRCGACTRACPMILQPHELYWYAKSKNFGKAQEYSLFDCIECGCCAFVCPSRIPLVDYYRFAKSEIRAREREKAAADTARERYEFRQLREERDKAEKAAKLAAKAAETKAKLAQEEAAKQATEQAVPADLIAAAQARAAAKKAAVAPQNTENLTPDQQAQIAAAEARRAHAPETKDSA